MKKYEYSNLVGRVSEKVFKDDILPVSDVYRLDDGNYLKVFKDVYLNFKNDLESKIADSEKLSLPKEIIKPNGICYSNGEFIGYTMPPSGGVMVEQMMYSAPLRKQFDLSYYNDIYKKIERVVELSNRCGIVFPDMCTLGNVHMTYDGNIRFIDYDGLQIGDEKRVFLSSALGKESEYENTKYKRNGIYTPELDKKSIIVHYFAYVFGIDLTDVKYEDIEFVLYSHGIYSKEIVDAVRACYTNEPNRFITELFNSYVDTHMLLPKETSKILVPGKQIRF